MKKILNITPFYSGYSKYPLDENGKIILPRNKDGVILIYRRNTINYGNGLIGLLDGSKITNSDWQDLRKRFVFIDDNGTENLYWCIGGSDSGTILGLSSFNTQTELYEKKKSYKPDDIDDNTDYVFEYGHRNEELIAQGFQTLTNMEVCKDNTVFFREDTGFMLADIDFFVRHPDGMFSILEIKSTNAENKTVINEYKNGRVPLYYYSQAVLHYPLVLGNVLKIKGTFFAIGFNNNLKDIIICHFDRDIEQEKILLSAEKEFADCLKYDVSPKETKVLDSKRLIESIREKYPVAKEKTIELKPDTLEAIKQYLALQKRASNLQAEAKKIESDANIYKAIILENMADAELSAEFEIEGTKMFCALKNSTRVSIDKTILINKYPDVYKEVSSETTFRTLKISKSKADKKKR